MKLSEDTMKVWLLVITVFQSIVCWSALFVYGGWFWCVLLAGSVATNYYAWKIMRAVDALDASRYRLLRNGNPGLDRVLDAYKHSVLASPAQQPQPPKVTREP